MSIEFRLGIPLVLQTTTSQVESSRVLADMIMISQHILVLPSLGSPAHSVSMKHLVYRHYK